MALRGWRLFGVAGTIFAYVIGILLLSLVSVQNPQQRRPRTRIYGETDPFQNRVLGLLGTRQPLQWCRELKYLDKEPIHPLHKPKPFPKLMQTFPGHFIKTKHENIPNQKLSTSLDSPSALPQSSSSSLLSSHLELTTKGLTALASFPGSGNTWLRYLIQQATGIYTGSVYKDYGLLKSGFPAENIFNSSVLVIKTHEWGPRAWAIFNKSILLVRDPEKAILAEFNRQSGGHVGFASPDRYKRTKGRYWQQFVTNKLWAWEQMNLGWSKNFTGEVKIIFYDDLVDNVEKVLRDILNFIKFPIDEDLLSCALIRREGIYRRKKRLMTFDPFSPAMHRLLIDKRNEVYAQLGKFININNNSKNKIIINSKLT